MKEAVERSRARIEDAKETIRFLLQGAPPEHGEATADSCACLTHRVFAPRLAPCAASRARVRALPIQARSCAGCEYCASIRALSKAAANAIRCSDRPWSASRCFRACFWWDRRRETRSQRSAGLSRGPPASSSSSGLPGLGLGEAEFRKFVYMAAVCRCFPGKNPKGGDRVPSPVEIANCRPWLDREIELLCPELIVPVGRLAIEQFLPAPSAGRTNWISSSSSARRTQSRLDPAASPLGSLHLAAHRAWKNPDPSGPEAHRQAFDLAVADRRGKSRRLATPLSRARSKSVATGCQFSETGLRRLRITRIAIKSTKVIPSRTDGR